MDDLAVKSISYAAYWALAGAVPALFIMSVLFYDGLWKTWRDRLRDDWQPTRWPFVRLLDFDAEYPNLLGWFVCHAVFVVVVVVLARYSPAADLPGMAVFAAELWLVVPIVLALMVIAENPPWRLAVGYAVVWLVRFQVVGFLVGLALLYPDKITSPSYPRYPG
ncbi:hypothetical protein [Nocardia concava]|uniref:hypothetical protein n=1 Tax=Nocardia concava TaxID=257281 RepID=UPI000311103C|nr:hypothetical protein [Nocardia concava]